jgi:hypothetical protein
MSLWLKVSFWADKLTLYQGEYRVEGRGSHEEVRVIEKVCNISVYREIQTFLLSPPCCKKFGRETTQTFE